MLQEEGNGILGCYRECNGFIIYIGTYIYTVFVADGFIATEAIV